MEDFGPTIISHASLGTNDYARAVGFYDRVLATLGIGRIMEHEGAMAYGRVNPDFWIQAPHDGGRASCGNGVHIGFIARTKTEVDAFFREAIAAGGSNDGEPGHRHEYGEPYYGCFIRDPDGNKIEATFWDVELARKLGLD